jgi:hypothetical protein
MVGRIGSPLSSGDGDMDFEGGGRCDGLGWDEGGGRALSWLWSGVGLVVFSRLGLRALVLDDDARV